jgi:peptidoglycan lytic transglycosylase G
MALAGGLAVLAFVVVHFVGGRDKPRPKPPTGPPTLRIVFPEGFTRAQMASRITAVDAIAKQRRHVKAHLSARAYLAATARSKLPARFGDGGKPHPLEGFLFPALYDFLPRTTSKQLVRDQLAAFRKNWARVGLSYARSKNLTPYDVLAIASMIEKEAGVPRDRALIAAVIYNRLRERMPLQIDATTRYGLHISGNRPLTDAELHSSNPYNTRRFRGLPPTPISNPGLPSMIAAAHPAHVDYLYFVRKPGTHRHYFTANYRDFLAHERAYGY